MAYFLFSDFNEIGVYLYVFWDDKLIEIYQKLLNSPGTIFFGQKWPKMSKNLKILAYFCFSDFNEIWVYLYVFWDEKLIAIYLKLFKSSETVFFDHFWPKMAKNQCTKNCLNY